MATTTIHPGLKERDAVLKLTHGSNHHPPRAEGQRCSVQRKTRQQPPHTNG